MYNKELEKNISKDDCNWNIQLYLYQFKHNPLVLRVGKGVKVWTQLTEDSKPIEWILDDIDSLKELKEYIKCNSSWDSREWLSNV